MTQLVTALNVVVFLMQMRFPSITTAGWKVLAPEYIAELSRERMAVFSHLFPDVSGARGAKWRLSLQFWFETPAYARRGFKAWPSFRCRRVVHCCPWSARSPIQCRAAGFYLPPTSYGNDVDRPDGVAQEARSPHDRFYDRFWGVFGVGVRVAHGAGSSRGACVGLGLPPVSPRTAFALRARRPIKRSHSPCCRSLSHLSASKSAPFTELGRVTRLSRACVCLARRTACIGDRSEGPVVPLGDARRPSRLAHASAHQQHVPQQRRPRGEFFGNESRCRTTAATLGG